MSREKLIKECSEYFQHNPGFSRIMLEIREKYKSFGKMGGTIKLNNLTIEEKEALTGFLKKNYYKDSVSISIEKFQAALDNTPFEGLYLIEIMEEYFGKDILTYREKEEIYNEERQQFFDEILNKTDGVAYNWLEFVLSSKENAYRLISQGYNKEKKELRNDLLFAVKGMNNLPYLNNNEKERLAIFASKISKNPHTFDENTNCGKLLLNGIVYILGLDYPIDAEERAEILYKAGIIKDEISNHTICSGLLAYKDEKVHCGWEGFYKLSEPLQPSIWNLSKIDKIISPEKNVYIFENPTVFSEILHRLSNKPSLVCTYGQVKLASLILLDKLVEGGAVLYYSGDYDPEGLIIADKLKTRYKDNLILWRYDKDDYIKSLSKNKIDETRTKKLDRLNDETLIYMGEIIKEYGYAGYQESILEELVEDVEKNIDTIYDTNYNINKR